MLLGFVISFFSAASESLPDVNPSPCIPIIDLISESDNPLDKLQVHFGLEAGTWPGRRMQAHPKKGREGALRTRLQCVGLRVPR